MTPTFESQSQDLVPVSGRQLAAVGAPSGNLPAIFLRSASASKRFWEFFTANIRNRNTRKAYFIAVSAFSNWCEARKLTLERVEPVHVAGYIEQLMQKHSKPTVKRKRLSNGIYSRAVADVELGG